MISIPTPEKIAEIAEELSLGFRAFLHKKTGETVFIPNELDIADADLTLWSDEVASVEANPSDYEEIEKWTSSDEFIVMENFTRQLSQNKPLRQKLSNALNENKPFRKFKAIIQEDGEQLERWYLYKKQCQINYVKNQLELIQSQEDD